MNRVIKYGIYAGLISGVTFAVYEVLYWWVSAGTPFYPLQMIAGIILQREPMTIGIIPAVFYGSLVHFVYSIILGIIMALVAVSVPAVSKSKSNMILFGTVFGVVLWIVNFYVLAFVLNSVWFPENSNPISEIISHTIFYGTIMAAYLSYKLPTMEYGSKHKLIGQH